MWQDIENIFDFDLSDEEIKELLIYSSDETNLKKRYIVACQIISNLGNLKEQFNEHDEAVDLTICKMLIDGDAWVEEVNPVLH